MNGTGGPAPSHDILLKTAITVSLSIAIAVSIKTFSKFNSQKAEKEASTTADESTKGSKKSSNNELLIRTGKLAKSIKIGLGPPPVEAFTISSGWTSSTITQFQDAITSVINANPILTSHLICKDDCIYACPGTFLPEEHDFVSVISINEDEEEDVSDVSNLSSEEALQFLDKFIAPRVKKNSTKKSRFITTISDDLNPEQPLFRAHIFTFSNHSDHVVYHIGVSHALVDAQTYYLLVQQVSAYMNGNEPIPIRWDNPHMPYNEFDPDHFTDRDSKQMSGINFVLGMFLYKLRSWVYPKREQSLIISKQALLDQKQVQLDTNITPYISSNDIIYSTLCKLITSSNHFIIPMDHRKRSKHFNEFDGGNCFKLIHVPTSIGSNPNLFRKIINKQYYYEPNELNVSSSIRCGYMGHATTWVTGYKSLEMEGIKTICHCPCLDFLRNMPADICVIFNLNDESLGLIYSFLSVDLEVLDKVKKEWLCQ